MKRIPVPRSPRIAGDRLDLVPLVLEDAEEMAVVLADPALYAHIGGRPPTSHELRERYRRWVAGPGAADEAWMNWTVRLRIDGRAIGHVQATLRDRGRQADIAWVVGVPWQGRGYASEATTALVRWLDTIGVVTVTAHVHPDNTASEVVAQRAGLVPTSTIEDGERVWRRDVRRPGSRRGTG